MSFTHQICGKGSMKNSVFSSPKKLISSFHALFHSRSPAVVFPSTRSDSRDSLGSSVRLSGINEGKSERVSFQGNSLDILPPNTLSCHSYDDVMEVLDMDEAVHNEHGNGDYYESISVDKSAYLSSDDTSFSSCNDDDNNNNGSIDDVEDTLNVVDVLDSTFIQIIPVQRSFQSISRTQKFRLENPCLPVSPRDKLHSNPAMLLRQRMKRFNKVHDSLDHCVV
eukprot:gene6888-7613_t